jgi:hypothetical protein
MKAVFRSLLFTCVLGLVSQYAVADMPVVNITGPTGTIYVSSFPYATNIAFNLTHSQLKDLHVLNVYVDGTSILPGGTDVGDPFDTSNNCKSPNLTTISTNCSTNGADQASVSVPWSVPAPGTYSLTVKVKHQSLVGQDDEEVSFLLAIVAVEYPAPPAVANSFINTTFGAKTGAKVRGCVISKIADNQAKSEMYGPRGGPYNIPLIQSDVLAYWGPCGGQ